MVQRDNQSYGKGIVLSAAIILGAIGCGPQNDASHKSAFQEAIDALNQPGLIPGGNGTLDTQFYRLPMGGTVASHVWTGHWWPYAEGGTAHRLRMWELSPLEKYDWVTGGSNAATNWELMQAQNLGLTSWAGHCNGLAAAGTMMAEPRHGVYYRGIFFNVEDVKALLTEMWQGGGKIIGTRCEESNPYVDNVGRMVNPACRDLNPGAFHVALTNFVGRYRKPIIVDKEASLAVWNHPIVAYQIKSVRQLSAPEAMQWLTGYGGYSYAYNSYAFSGEYVDVVVVYEKGDRIEYEYILELDARGAIIGGEWFGRSKVIHPDFMWRHTSPQPENPYIDVNVVLEIHRGSL